VVYVSPLFLLRLLLTYTYTSRLRNTRLVPLVEARRMIQRARDNWQCFKQSEPGHRFQDHHRYQQGRSGSRSYLRGFFGILWGLLVVVGGLIAVPGPGPGWLVILLGLGLVAGESLFFACLFDRAEVKLRGLVGQVIGLWRIFPTSVRILIVVGLVACATAMGISLIS
jgi:Flp pilus assembly protein TadB